MGNVSKVLLKVSYLCVTTTKANILSVDTWLGITNFILEFKQDYFVTIIENEIDDTPLNLDEIDEDI